MKLLNELIDKYMNVSIMQMMRSAGKYSTMSHLISAAADGDLTLGVTASGSGGVRLDSQNPSVRPRYWMPEGMLATVPAQLFDESDAGLEILRMTNYPTALGHILICRIAEPGYVTVAGPIAASYRKAVCDEMAELGAGLILTDSSLSGRGAVYADTSDASIICTGAVVSPFIDKAVRETAHMAMMYTLPQLADEDAASIIQRTQEHGRILVLRKYRGVAENAGPAYDVEKLYLKSSIGGVKYLDSVMDANVRYIFFPGVFTPGIVRDISMYNLSQVTFVVNDPTDIMMDSESWAELSMRGMKVEVLRNINVAAITMNPYAPGGYSFDTSEFKERLVRAIPRIPVIDVREEERNGNQVQA
jgi:hypothetical protein